jgi:hypothetical protein
MSIADDHQIPVALTNLLESPIEFANHFIVQWQADEFVLSLSQTSENPVFGTPDEQRAQARASGNVQVNTVARVAFNRRRLIELVGLLQDRLREHDRVLGEREREAA